jgi:membrane fusion protein (multidrug efflux system)
LPALCCLLALLTACGEGSKKAPGQAALKVVLAEVGKTMVRDETIFNATLAAKETVEVRTRISGYIQERLFEEGRLVKQGDVLYRLDDRDLKAALDSAKAEASSAETTWKNDEVTKNRYLSLTKTGAISMQDRDRVVTKAAESLAAYNSAKAVAEKAAVNLGYATISAPITGYIARSSVDVGGYAQAGTTLLTTIYRIDPIRAEFSLTDGEFARLRQAVIERGDQRRDVSFKLTLGDERVPYKYPGSMEMIDPVVDSKTNTIGVRVEFPNPDRLLRPGLYVNVVASLGEREALTVPEAAIVERGGSKNVFMVDENNTLVAVPVVIGSLTGDRRVIEQGLKAGQKVVVEGLVAAQPGMRVEVVEKQDNPSHV